jgi:hypothetical protein
LTEIWRRILERKERGQKLKRRRKENIERNSKS